MTEYLYNFRISLEFHYTNTFELSITKQLQKHTHGIRKILCDGKQE